jgi:hypothetical protein
VSQKYKFNSYQRWSFWSPSIVSSAAVDSSGWCEWHLIRLGELEYRNTVSEKDNTSASNAGELSNGPSLRCSGRNDMEWAQSIVPTFWTSKASVLLLTVVADNWYGWWVTIRAIPINERENVTRLWSVAALAFLLEDNGVSASDELDSESSIAGFFFCGFFFFLFVCLLCFFLFSLFGWFFWFPSLAPDSRLRFFLLTYDNNINYGRMASYGIRTSWKLARINPQTHCRLSLPHIFGNIPPSPPPPPPSSPTTTTTTTHAGSLWP